MISAKSYRNPSTSPGTPRQPQPLDPGFLSTEMKKCHTASLLWGSPQSQQELEAQVAVTPDNAERVPLNLDAKIQS